LTEAAIALGSNLGDSRATLERAVALIDERVGRVVARSAWLETAALVHPDDPVRDHPPYLNGVVIAETGLPALDLLATLLEIERMLGRVRDPAAPPWQPRTVDLDLILLGEQATVLPGLTLPHPRMQERDFVLRPLVSVRPAWRHPLLGRSAAELLQALEQQR
jgi:2-amino-4-hydroxy-6-hydroxymethyldihydropteridine diphosphokinase